MGTAEVFRRAFRRGLAILGEASTLNGVPAGNVEVVRDVQMFAGLLDQANDNAIVRHDVASIEALYAPKVDQILVHPREGRFRLMRLLADDGIERRFVVVQEPAP